MSRGLRYWLRWIAVLPGGVVAALLVTFPLHWAILLIYAIGGSPDASITQVDEFGEERGCALMGLTCFVSAETLERLGMSFIVPYLIIFAGAWVAPSQRMIAGIAMAILVALGLGSVYTFSFSAPQFGYSGWESLHYGATPALNLLAVGLALFTVWQKWGTPESPPALQNETSQAR